MSEIKCIACGKMYTERGLSRHLKSCKKLKEKYKKGSEQTYYKINIYNNLGYGYSLYIDIKANATLGDLDKFLRDIWLESYDHCSEFEFKDRRYPMYESIYSESGIDKKLGKVLEVKDKFKYEYDFGTPTVLHCKVIDAVKGADRENIIEILARNEEHVYKCEECDKEATHVLEDWSPEFYCEDHLENSDEYYLPIVNSPRMGVCGYFGPEEQYKDIVSWGKSKKIKK